jgi:ectonucleotide pyrophosphatase/phosphodiesterase family protein 1/3
MNLVYNIIEKKLKRVIPFLFFILFLKAKGQNTILISIDGVRHNDIKHLPFIDSLSKSFVSTLSLKPVFPTQTLPNIASILTGKSPSSHGISANYFKNIYTNEYFIFDNESFDSKWMNSELIWKKLKKIGINTISVDYPLTISDNKDPNSPKYHFKKDSSYLNELMETVNENDKNFVAIHFKTADLKAHEFGNHSTEFLKELKEIDSEIKKIKDLFDDEVNFIVHSTFGTTELDTNNFIDLNSFDKLNEEFYINSGSMVLIYDSIEIGDLFNSDSKINHFNYYQNIPFHFNSFTDYNKPDILLVAKNGFVFSEDSTKLSKLKAVHGYDANLIEMQGFFSAFGNDFQKHYSIGTIEIQNIYDLIMSTYGIKTENYRKIQNILKSTTP